MAFSRARDRCDRSLPPFGRVLQNGTGLSVDTDLVGNRPNFDVERVAQTGAALPVLQFLVENLTRLRLQGGGTGLIEGNRCCLRQILRLRRREKRLRS